MKRIWDIFEIDAASDLFSSWPFGERQLNTYSPLNSTALKQIKNYTSDFTNAHLINKFHTLSMI